MPAVEFWNNPATYGAIVGVGIAIIVGFFTAWAAADNLRIFAENQGKLEKANEGLKTQVTSVQTELSATRADLTRARADLKMLGGELGAPTFQTPDQRSTAARKAEVSALLGDSAASRDGYSPGQPSDKTDVDFINAKLRQRGRDYHVALQGTDVWIADGAP